MTRTRDRLISDVSEFCKKTGLSRREFGLRASGNTSFWARLSGTASDQTSLNLKTIERAENFMEGWPPSNEQAPAPAAFR